MKYFVERSLEHLVLIKIVVELWKHNDIRDLIGRFNTDGTEEWLKIEDRVIKKVPELPLPEKLYEKVEYFIRPVGLQILKWIEYHCKDRNLYINVPIDLHWTSQGTIDRKKTAQMIIRDEKLAITKRYKLACINCLEDDILELWRTMSQSLRDTFSRTDFPSISYHRHMVNYWTHIILQRDGVYSSNQSTFEYSAKSGNKVAAEYILKKLTPREKDESLLRTAKHVTDAEVLCLLLSHMDEEQQIEVFKNNPRQMLLCFIDWPLQSFFIDVADHVWDFLAKKDYDNLLKELILRPRLGYKDYNYEILFNDFWKKSPISLKNYVISESNNSFLLPHLLLYRNKEKVKFLLQDVNLAEKNKLIHSDMTQNICICLICDGSWDLLRLLIEECLSSENDMRKFKEEVESRVHKHFMKNLFARNKHQWDQLFPWSDECDESECVEESYSSRRICCVQ